jgi:hypothetical protein
MRRGSSTIVSLIGGGAGDLLLGLRSVANVTGVQAVEDGLDAAIDALARAERSSSPYVVVNADPLSDIAAEWAAMWAGTKDATALEVTAAATVNAWRRRRFELPDYYLALTELAGQRDTDPGADFHMGFLKSQRPGRVISVVPSAEPRATLLRALDALSRLPQGPWWPPLDRIVESSRTFFPAGLTSESSIANSGPT